MGNREDDSMQAREHAQIRYITRALLIGTVLLTAVIVSGAVSCEYVVTKTQVQQSYTDSVKASAEANKAMWEKMPTKECK